MRISTSQIYDAGTLGIQRNQSALLKQQEQISSETRILTAADDPIGAAQALVVTQSLEVNAQQQTNQASASSQLALVDSHLSSLTTLLQNVRDGIVRAGGGSLTDADRATIATTIESNLSEMQGIANSDNGTGDYLFSGYQGATLPFAVSGDAAIAPSTSSPIAYYGDDGQRLLQVSSSRQLPVSVSGSDLFMSASTGNGTFVATTGGNTSGTINQGTATIDSGSVLDQQQWKAAVNLLPNTPSTTPPVTPKLQIQFTVDATTSVTSYQLFDASSATAEALTDPTTYTAGQTISLVTTLASSSLPVVPTDFGSQVVISGAPSDGDTFTITPSTSQNTFQTLQNLIGILKTPVGTSTYTSTQKTNDLALQLNNIDQAMSQVSQIQSTIGTSMNEVDSLSSTSADLKIQYSATLSGIQDLDYAAALSDFSKQQVALEAAQKSFVAISGLSLFKYM